MILGLLIVVEVVQSAVMPIAQPSDTLKELESLLHFAIRNSDPSKLHELASNQQGQQMSPEEVSEMMEAVYSSESQFIESINRTILYREFDSEIELFASIDFIEDYGDHLLDKGDVFHRIGALDKLVEWVTTCSDSPSVHKRITDLLVTLTQNREPTKKLVLQIDPNFPTKIFHFLTTKYTCENDDKVCASLVSVVTAVIGGNESLVKSLDETVIASISEYLNTADPASKFFARILTLIKVVTIVHPDSQWKSKVNMERLFGFVGSINISVGEKILDLIPSRDSAAHARLYDQCLRVREDSDSCSRYRIDSREEL